MSEKNSITIHCFALERIEMDDEYYWRIVVSERHRVDDIVLWDTNTDKNTTKDEVFNQFIDYVRSN